MNGCRSPSDPTVASTTLRINVFAIPDETACDTDISSASIVVKCEDVSNDPIDSEPPPSRRGPMAFMRRHRVALLVVAVAVALMVGLLLYVRHKQSASAPAGAGRGGENGPVAVS